MKSPSTRSPKLSACNFIVMTLIVTQCTWQDALSVNILESVPPAVNGVLTVYAGQQISLTCGHDIIVTAVTRWIASPPVDCVIDISHIGSNPPTPPPCGPFMFQGITPQTPLPLVLNSTAVAIAQDNMNGTNVECIGGNAIRSSSVGNVSLFVMSPTVVAPIPIVEAQFFCANSSDLTTTVVLSWMFPSIASPGIVYPPVHELNVTVVVSILSGLIISNTIFQASQGYAFFHLRNDANFTLTVNSRSNHDDAGSSVPETIQLTTSSYTVDTSRIFQDDEVSIRLNERCREDPTSFMTTLSYGSCLTNLQYAISQTFNSSGVALFELQLDIENVIGSLCLQVQATHQNRSTSPLSTFDQRLPLNSCSVAPINSVASSSVTVEFSLAESSGQVPHGTVASFNPLSCADQLVGAEHATCLNGMWNDLSHRTSSSPLSTTEVVAITFVLTMISTLIVGTVSSFLVTYCVMKQRWASKHPAIDEQSKGALYEEVSQPKTSDQGFEMGENIAYGLVRH